MMSVATKMTIEGPQTVRSNEVTVTGAMREGYADILTDPALRFLAALHHTFEPRRRHLLERRWVKQQQLDAGHLPDFLSSTRSIRESEWRVAPIPKDLTDRRVEITGPVDRKTIINGLNSGANVFMADFEDAHAPTWANTMNGQINLRDAVSRTITFTRSDGRRYALNEQTATLFVRPRGWHLEERRILACGKPISASLFDFGLFFFHNAATLRARGSAPYFYLPKLEHRREARLWNEVFSFAQDYLDMPHGTIRATVLIENILAAFEMDEILWELKDHSAGLNCGRWDYIFSFIKKFRAHADFVLPNRDQVSMEQPFLRSYSQLLIQTSRRRGTHAIGGMAAQIPVKDDPEATQSALREVQRDKLREVTAGHDGTWVAHPGLVETAKTIFDQHMPDANQIHLIRDDGRVTAADLLRVPLGSITEAGLNRNISVGIQYLSAWLRGSGCVAISNLMEDAATAEISRAQVWQWIRHGALMNDGRPITVAHVRRNILDFLSEQPIPASDDDACATSYLHAAELMEWLVTQEQLPEWLTTAVPPSHD